jgi:hypothetical protein
MDERTGDAPHADPAVGEGGKALQGGRSYRGWGLQSRLNFNYLDLHGIEPIIKVLRNSSTRARGSPTHGRAVLEQLEDPEGWKKRTCYGSKWMGETSFSVFKQVFGESISAKSFTVMVQGIVIKTSLYNLFMRLSPSN